MAIKVYNTLTRSKEELRTREQGKVHMYVCGPTVYNYIHIGNARTFLNFDIIRRYLEFSGYQVNFVQNITDVDDKIINRAAEEGTTSEVIAEKYRRGFEEDMQALGVAPPTIAPRATEHIAEMVGAIKELVEKGHAYQSGGDVYFAVDSFPEYGRLSGRNLEEQRVTVQCAEEMGKKRDPLDFALWKASKPGEPCWESPWGPGRPGWHIECSTMSRLYLGEDFDIHGGGQDLIFPHHENEIAQAEALSGERFVRYWMHSGMLNVDAEKMSKSLGNIMLLRDVLSQHSADTVRMLALSTHYRSPLNFSEESLEEARASLDRIRNCLFNLRDSLSRAEDREGGEPEDALESLLALARREFRARMDDDFNTAAALGSIFDLVRRVNTYLASVPYPSRKTLEKAREVLIGLCSALGLFQSGEKAAGVGRADLLELYSETGIEVPPGAEGLPSEALVESLLEARLKARSEGDFSRADRIRDGLLSLGIRVEDVKDGYRWRFERRDGDVE